MLDFPLTDAKKGEGMRGAEGQNRTGDTRIFSPLLYRLSYLGVTCEIRTMLPHDSGPDGSLFAWSNRPQTFRLNGRARGDRSDQAPNSLSATPHADPLSYVKCLF